MVVALTKMSVYADFVQNLLVHFLSLDCKGVYLSCMKVEDLENKSSIVKGYILLVPVLTIVKGVGLAYVFVTLPL